MGYAITHLVVVTTLSTARAVFSNVKDLQSDDQWKAFGLAFVERATSDGFRGGNVLSSAFLNDDVKLGLMVTVCLTAAAAVWAVWRNPPLVLDLQPEARLRPDVCDLMDTLVHFMNAVHAGRPLLEQRLVRSIGRHAWTIRPGFLGLVLPSLEAWCYFGGGIALLVSGITEPTACFLLAVLAVYMVHNQATETREALMPVLGPALDRPQVSMYLQAPTASMLNSLTVARVRVHRSFILPSTCCSIVVLVGVALGTGHPWAAVVAVCASAATLLNVTWVQWYMSALLMTDGASDRRHEQGSGSWTAEVQSTMQGWVRYPIVVLPGVLLLVVLVAGGLLPPETGAFGAALTVVGALIAALILPRISSTLSARAWRSALSHDMIRRNG